MRYVKNVFYGFLIWLAMPIIVHVPTFLLRGVLFPALCQWFPGVFVNYSPVTEPEQYAVMSTVLSTLVGVLAIFIFSYITVRYDNERMEYMIKVTEGMYRRLEGVNLYYPRYIRSDVAVAIIVPLPLIVASIFVPEQIHEYVDPIFEYLFAFGRSITDELGYIFGTLLICSSVLLTRLASGYISLGAWQSIWLSETN